MDYFDVFRNIKGNCKYSRKSPEKSVLLLAVINLFEEGKISDNEIRYNDTLKSEYLRIWNQLLPYDNKLYSDAYVAFWYLESERFWHTVPYRNHSEVLELMRDAQIKPSETKLVECVDYAELDEDLHFLMTMKFGRTELRSALMESSFNLTDEEVSILKTNQGIDDAANKEVVENPIENEGNDNKISSCKKEFQKLSVDTQILLNFEYYSFLKNNRYDRDWFLGVFPNVETFYQKITDSPLTRNDIDSAFIFTYKDFLFDLKINLMSEDDTAELIDSINFAIGILDDVVSDNHISEGTFLRDSSWIGICRYVGL